MPRVLRLARLTQRKALKKRASNGVSRLQFGGPAWSGDFSVCRKMGLVPNTGASYRISKEESMTGRGWLKIPVAVLTLWFVVGSAPRQVQAQCCPLPVKVKPATAASSDPVFCPVKSTGQLCDHGTAALLKLSGETRARWVAAVRDYNRAVEAAQRRLVGEAGRFLSAQEVAQLQAWLATQKPAGAASPGDRSAK